MSEMSLMSKADTRRPKDLIKSDCSLSKKRKISKVDSTFKTRVILCNTLKKEVRAFRNVEKYIPVLCNQPY